MPSTVIYKSGFPSTATPVETSAQIAADGLVTGSAVFLVSDGSTAFPINQSISQSFFSALRGVNLQGLFVETRSLERRNGLFYLRVGVVGVVNPPVFETRREVSPRSLNKSATFNEEVSTFSFDYLAETITVSTAVVGNLTTDISVPNPNVIARWNLKGNGFILSWNPSIGESAPPDNFRDLILAYPRVLISQTSEIRSNVVRISKSAQFVYE